MDGLRINGQLQYVRCTEDFIDLVSKYMGIDAEKYLQSVLYDYQCEINALRDEIDSLSQSLYDY